MPRIFNGCVAALAFNYAAAALYCAVGVAEANWYGAAAHVLAGCVLVSQSRKVDLGSEVEIKKFYMVIWKLFYAEYLILLLL